MMRFLFLMLLIPCLYSSVRIPNFKEFDSGLKDKEIYYETQSGLLAEVSELQIKRFIIKQLGLQKASTTITAFRFKKRKHDALILAEAKNKNLNYKISVLLNSLDAGNEELSHAFVIDKTCSCFSDTDACKIYIKENTCACFKSKKKNGQNKSCTLLVAQTPGSFYTASDFK